jgi:FkbM family methyltransferase
MTPDANLKDMEFDTVGIDIAGRSVRLADLPEYRKFYEKLAAGQWEPNTIATLREYLDKDTVLVDIGAWIGVTPFFGAGLAKAVIAVDPDPKCAAILKRLAVDCEKVAVIQGALSDAPSVAIHAVDGFGSSETSVLEIGNSECAAANGLRLGDILNRAQGSPILVKVDIEGYEFLIGGELDALADFPVKAVQIAVHPQLYERTLHGSRLARRLKTALATWRLAHRLGRHFSRPRLFKYPNLATYILLGVILRATPRGADLLFEQRLAKA